jgi:hypothetical protein
VIELLTDQTQSDAAFRLWVDAMLAASRYEGTGWLLNRGGMFFTNYGQAPAGEIDDQVMLGHDTETRDGTVKIVRPDVGQGDRGKLTTIGRSDSGALILLRVGWLQPNNVSRLIKADFSELTGLRPVAISVGGKRSKRHWFVVADLSKSRQMIVDQTAAFTLACIRARTAAGGGAVPVPESNPYSLGLDEKGRVIEVERKGGKAAVRLLQGYVFKELRKRLGEALTKPKANGYAVDGMFEAADLLVEIKTGTFAKHCYEGVGQLMLYPSLIGLRPDLKRALLLPGTPPLRAVMAQALHDAGVEVYTYEVGDVGKKPKIKFVGEFLAACRGTPS